MPEGLFFRQLLAGEDFAVGDEFATTMRNHVYVIGDAATREVVMVDPAYDVAALVNWADHAGLRLVGALATHYHADHIGGDIFGEHIEGLVDLLEIVDIPVLHKNLLQYPSYTNEILHPIASDRPPERAVLRCPH